MFGFKKTINRKKRRKNISSGAPTASHTKGFYRFAKDFPSVTDSSGYRDNEVFLNASEKKASVRRRLALVFVVVFIIGFAGTSVGFAMSQIPAVYEPELPTENDSPKVSLAGYNSVFLTGDILSYSNINSIATAFSSIGVNTVVIEFKDASGYVYFRPSVSVAPEALYRVSANASSVVKSFKNSGFTVFAYVSCFADDIYARNNQNEAAYVQTEQQSGDYNEVKTLWYDGSAESHAWLSPYSETVTDYLSSIISDISAMGVDGVILNDVTFPSTSDDSVVRFEDQPSEDANHQSKMTDFVNDICENMSCKVGSVISAGNMIKAMNDGSVPSIINSDCDMIVLDSRLSTVPENTELGGKSYAKASDSPYMFMLDFADYAVSYFNNNDCDSLIMPIIEASDSSASQITAVAAQNIRSFIMYDSAMEYEASDFQPK